MTLKYRTLIEFLSRHGFVVDKHGRGEQVFRHPIHHGRISIPKHKGDLRTGTAHKIIKRLTVIMNVEAIYQFRDELIAIPK